MKRNSAWILLAVLTLTAASAAQAALPGNEESVEEVVAQTRKTQLDVSSYLSSDFFQDSRHAVTTQLMIMPSMGVAENYSLTARFTLDVPVYGPDKNPGFEDGVLSLRRKKLEINPVFSFSPGAGLIIPVSRDSAVRRTMLLGMKLSPRLNMDFSKTHAPAAIQNLRAFYELDPSFFAHQFESTVDGYANTRFGLSHVFNLQYVFWNSGLAFTWSPTLSTSWTYNGVARSRFTMDEELSYSINNQWGVSVGISNSGDYLAANGSDSNLSFLDQNRSSFYLSLSAGF